MEQNFKIFYFILFSIKLNSSKFLERKRESSSLFKILMLLFIRFSEFYYHFSIGGYKNSRRNKIPQQSTVNVSFTRTRDNNSVWENPKAGLYPRATFTPAHVCMRELEGPRAVAYDTRDWLA